ELFSAKVVAWAEAHSVRLHYIQPGKPTQNACIERFNRTFRREVLDAHVFTSLSEVREIVHEWMTTYNEEHPHEALGNVPPSIFSQQQAQPKTEPLPAPDSTYELFR
ncbi:MAG: transposase, partial [bacterium]